MRIDGTMTAVDLPTLDPQESGSETPPEGAGNVRDTVPLTAVPDRTDAAASEKSVSVFGIHVKESTSDAVLVPAVAMMVTSPVPVPPGAVAEMLVSEFTVNDKADADPNFTAVTLVKSVPAISTGVPPSLLPIAGSTETTVGAGTVAVVVVDGVVVTVDDGDEGLPPQETNARTNGMKNT